MSADIGVPWRSSAVCGSESRSPSLSSLPPLPDLIPIRKGKNTLIKANLKHATGQTSGPVCTTKINSNMSNIQHSDQNGNIANDCSIEKATTDDKKPSAAELSLCQSYDGKQNGREQDNDHQSNDDNMNVALTIKQERRHSDDEDAPRQCANANSADAMANVCVSIGASYFTNRNGNTVQCDSNVDGGHIKQFHKSTSSLVKNEKCQNHLMNNNSQCNSETAFGTNHQNAVNINQENTVHEKCENIHQQTIKAGNKKNQNYNASDIPKRTTRSALDTYECKARLYTPLPAHYYSVQYARAPRKPKRKVLKGKGRGGVTKVGRKPKTKSNSQNASLALSNVTEKSATPQTPSKINPIFLFVKRDNTRIVEVRCEDYDKRNRIRLTKTASGWRAIPRTNDSSPSSSSTTNNSASMQPKVMLKRLDSESTETQVTNENDQPSTESNTNSTWRVNPFSQNRIFIKKNVCSLNNNNDSEFNSMYENRQSSDCNSSNAEHSSGLDTSASDKVHLLNESSTRKKHKKKKKKKKQKHKSKLDKVMSGQHFVTHSDASSKQTIANSANIVDVSEKAHATLIPKSMLTASNASGNANECKFTIRLSKNGESSFVATKKFSTISSTSPPISRSPKTENVITTEKRTGLKLKIISERQQFLTERAEFREEHEQVQENSNSSISNNDGSNSNTNSSEMHSAAIEHATNIQCDRDDQYGECDARIQTNLDALSASVNELVASIDCEKIDTKKEVVTPAVSPYTQVAYPSLSPPSSSSPSLQPHQPIPTSTGGAVEISNTFIQPTTTAQPSTPSTTISSCRKAEIETFASPDSAPIETFDSKLSVKQCVASVNSAAAAEPPNSTQFQCSDNNNQIANVENNLSDEKHLSDCVDLLDDSSYDIETIQVSEPHEIGVDSESHSNQLHHDLGEYHDLIARIQSDNDLLNGDNTMSGADLIDSLVERECKNNNISGDDDDNQHTNLKDSICLSDDYNDVDTNLLLSSQPVVDILSRLNSETMQSSSSKCFGEIDGLSDSLFSNSKSDGLVPFNQNTFDELSMTLKGLEKQTNPNTIGKDVVCTTIVSPDSCEDELPKDLSFKKTKELVTSLRVASPRTISRGSDAIQSPQPSGLPAVPPSPDIIMALHQHNKKQNPLFLDISSPSPKPSEPHLLNSKGDFFDLSSPLSKDDNEHTNATSINTISNSNSTRSILKRTLQREPLDLGHKHRKSASPTISCSEEVQRGSIDGEPLARRIKTEHRTDNNLLATTSKDTSQSASAKDPDPLTQLRLLINNPEWKLPDPILVPKNRLNAVLASPAREIPLLLTTRPELRLPEAFAYPSILQDPDILVISFAQLETIIRKQSEFMKDADPNRNMANKHSTTSIQSQSQLQTQSKQNTPQREQQQSHHHSNQHHLNSHHKDRKHADKLPETPLAHDKTPVKSSISTVRQDSAAISPSGNNTNLANDINSATLEALNQMFWLPYLSQMSQMGQITPELLKAMSLPNLAAMQSNAFSATNQFGLPSAMPNINNPLELAMWQEAAANKAAIQRLMDLNAQNVREAQRKAINEAKLQQRNQENIAAALRQQNLLQQQAQMQKSASAFFQNFQNSRTTSSAAQKTVPPFLSSTFGKDNPNDTSSRTSCNLQSPPLSKRVPNSLAQNPFFAAANNFPNMTNLHKFGMSTGTSTESNNNGTSTNALRKARKEQILQQQQQHLQSLLLQNAQQHSQVNMSHQSNDPSNKSLMSLLQQSNIDHIRTPRNDNITSNKMNTIPSFDLTSPNSSTQNTATNRPKLRVKNGLHLLDPMAAQRRFLSNARCNESPEIGSTTNGIDEMLANAGVLNSQSSSYSSPWHWTKVTATGE